MKKTLKNVIVGSLLLGATALGGAGGFYANRVEAANGDGSDEKYVLIASIGNMSGKQTPWLFRFLMISPRHSWKNDPVTTVSLTFDDIASCEEARSNFMENYRDEVFNSVCITMPKNGDISIKS